MTDARTARNALRTHSVATRFSATAMILLLVLSTAMVGCGEAGRVAELGPSSDGPSTAMSSASEETASPPMESMSAVGDESSPAGIVPEPAPSRSTTSADAETPGGPGEVAEKSTTTPRTDAPIRPESAEGEARDREIEEAARNLPQMQAGVLTAGSFDDHRNFDYFQLFLAGSAANDPYETLPRLGIQERLTLRVHNGQGEPLSNAEVEIAPANSQQQNAARTLQTGTDGRLLFLPQLDLNGQRQYEYQVTVRTDDGQTVSKKVDVRQQGEHRIEATHAKLQRPKQLDVALVLDATGSMGDEIEYLKIEIDHIASTVKQMFPSVDQRFALIVYRDRGDQFVTRTYDFNNLSEFRKQLSTQSASGGGDYPEAMEAAMEAATQLQWRAGNTARMMFLVGDAPPHDDKAARALAAANQLRRQNVRIYPVAASGTAWKAEYVLRASAFLTMGEYLFLTDHSGVGNAHASPHVPEFQVEHLNRLMTRMITQELAGKKLAPAEVIAIEKGDLSPLQFQPLQPQELSRLQQHPTQTIMLPPTPQHYCGVSTQDTPSLFGALVKLVVINWLSLQWIFYGAIICGVIILGAVFNF